MSTLNGFFARTSLQGQVIATPAVGAAKQELGPGNDNLVPFDQGTGANQANQYGQLSASVTASSSNTHDLNTALADGYGQSVSFTAIKVLRIRNYSLTQSLTVGAAASNPFLGPMGGTSPAYSIPPATAAGPGELYWINPSAAGWPCTSGSADQLKVANGSGSAAAYTVETIGLA